MRGEFRTRHRVSTQRRYRGRTAGNASGRLELRDLLQPIRHAHLAVHRRRRGEVLLRLLALAGAPIELAEAEVAVGDEGRMPTSPRSFGQLVQQRLRVSKVGGVEALGEPAVDRREKIRGLLVLALRLPEACEAGGSTQLP